jgi:hypothetical protein
LGINPAKAVAAEAVINVRLERPSFNRFIPSSFFRIRLSVNEFGQLPHCPLITNISSSELKISFSE